MVDALSVVAIALLSILALGHMSLRANHRLRDRERLPMQWTPDGSVNWTAPRPLALAFTPVLAALMLFVAVASTIFLEPRRGQEHLVIPVVLLMAFALIGAHALHLRLIKKMVERSDV